MNRLFVNALKSVGLVGSGDDPEATVTFWKSADLNKRTFSQEQREALAEKGQALPDGSFPIVTKSDLQNAVQAFGRASNKAAARKHIISRARALGATEMLPDSWEVTKMDASAESAQVVTGEPMDLSAIESEDLRKSIEDALAEKDSQISELTAKVDDLTPDPDPVEKADDEVRALIEKEREEREALQKQLDAERATRREAEFLAKAKKLEYAVGKPEDIASHLEKLEAAAPESYAELEKVLQTAASRVEAAMNQGLFKELGTSEGTEAAYEDKRDAWVEKNRKDGESLQEARGRFLKSSEGRQAKQELRS